MLEQFWQDRLDKLLSNNWTWLNPELYEGSEVGYRSMFSHSLVAKPQSFGWALYEQFKMEREQRYQL